MSCLAHNKRFRSVLHAVVNELRNENRTSPSVLRIIPNKCCTCKVENTEKIDPIVLQDDNDLPKLKYLIELVNKEKQPDPKLVLSLNHLKTLIQTNRSVIQLLPDDNEEMSNMLSTSSSNEIQTSVSRKRRLVCSSSSSSDVTTSYDSSSSSSYFRDDGEITVSKPTHTLRSEAHQMKKKTHKPIIGGTFLFLTYYGDHGNKTKGQDPLLHVAKELQRRHFIGRHGQLSVLSKRYNVHINMITQKTSKEVTEALEKAKEGLDNLKIHNREESIALSEKVDGEWFLIQSKKTRNKKRMCNFDQVLDEITNQWTSCLKADSGEQSQHDNSDSSTSNI